MTRYDDPTSTPGRGGGNGGGNGDDDADLGAEALLADAALAAGEGSTIDEAGAAPLPGENPFDAVVAAATAALVQPVALRADLAARIAADARRYITSASASSDSSMRIVPGTGPAASPPPRTNWLAWSGWAVAAAACVALAFVANRDPRSTTLPGGDEPPGAVAAASVDPVRERSDFIARGPEGMVRLPWSPPAPEAAPVEGDIVWSTPAQKGYMRFANLPVNNPDEYVYQLWIFDPSQKHPVDGGVFSVNAAGEAVVPIDPKLKVSGATLFAVTKEKPGGVVVSDQSQIVVVAKPS